MAYGRFAHTLYKSRSFNLPFYLLMHTNEAIYIYGGFRVFVSVLVVHIPLFICVFVSSAIRRILLALVRQMQLWHNII